MLVQDGYQAGTREQDRMSDYTRITQAIRWLEEHQREQPTLAELAAALGLSPFHLQRLFSRWAGTSPKRFLQVLTLQLGKQLLDEGWPVLDASLEAGLGSASRLHDHFVQLEGVTPGEYRRAGEDLRIRFGVADSPFGALLLAWTPRGICRANFVDDDTAAAAAQHTLATEWPGATLEADAAGAISLAQRIFATPVAGAAPLNLHVRGTNFQLAIWRALLAIPAGRAVSYGQLAAACGTPKAARAVGTAVGANPVAVLIPCHRVIQQSGALGGYRWGPERKLALQAWERLQAEAIPEN